MKLLFASISDLGERLKTVDIESVVSSIVYFDLVVNAFCNVLDTTSFDPFWMDRMATFISNFTTTVLVLEIATLLTLFRTSFFSHSGYCIDAFLLGTILYNDICGLDLFDGHVRLLFGLGRLSWRLPRLVEKMLNRAEERHNGTKENLERSKKIIETLRFESKQLNECKKMETDLRRQIEKMLMTYKNELQTMTEALSIAAMDQIFLGENANVSKMNDETKQHNSGKEACHFPGWIEKQNIRVFVNEDGSFGLK